MYEHLNRLIVDHCWLLTDLRQDSEWALLFEKGIGVTYLQSFWFSPPTKKRVNLMLFQYKNIAWWIYYRKKIIRHFNKEITGISQCVWSNIFFRICSLQATVEQYDQHSHVIAFDFPDQICIKWNCLHICSVCVGLEQSSCSYLNLQRFKNLSCMNTMKEPCWPQAKHQVLLLIHKARIFSKQWL